MHEIQFSRNLFAYYLLLFVYTFDLFDFLFYFFIFSFPVDWLLRNNYKMSVAPKLEDLPKVADDFKSELEHFSTDKLKDTVTNEKIVLPTAEGMFRHLSCLHSVYI